MINKLLSVTLVILISLGAMAQTTPKSQSGKKDKPTVGLVLSGGGALGFAHVGALKALEEVGIEPSYVAGASMGALVGVFVAAGYSSENLCELVFDEKMYDINKILKASLRPKSLGFSSHDKVRALLDKYIPYNSFDSLKLHYAVSASNLSIPESRLVTKGNQLKEYVIASMSIPGVFETIVIDGDHYVDGGLLNNLPTQAIRKDCDVVIGIDVQPTRPLVEMKNLLGLADRCMIVLPLVTAQEGRKLCDFVIDSPACDHYSTFDFDKFEEIYRIGYLTMKDYIRDHPDMVTKCNISPVKEPVNPGQADPPKPAKKWWQFWK